MFRAEFGMPEEGHSKSDRMHADCRAIITTPMGAGWSCNVEKQEHLHLLGNHGKGCNPTPSWVDISCSWIQHHLSVSPVYPNTAWPLLAAC